MSTSTVPYYDVMNRVHRLTSNDQLRLLEDLAALIHQKAVIPKKRSILELQGLGKEIWKNIDVQEYINKERSSWNG